MRDPRALEASASRPARRPIDIRERLESLDRGRREQWLLCVSLAIFLMLRTASLRLSPTVWQDEVETAGLEVPGGIGPAVMATVRTGTGSPYGQPSTVTAYVHQTAQNIFGHSIVTTRLLALLSATVAAVLLFAILRSLRVRPPVPLSGALLLLSDSVFANSAHGGRADSLAVMLSLLGGYAVVQAAQRRRLSWAYAAGMCFALSLFAWPTAFLGVFYVPALLLLCSKGARFSVLLVSVASGVIASGGLLTLLLGVGISSAVDDMAIAMSTGGAPIGVADLPVRYALLYVRTPWMPVLVALCLLISILRPPRHTAVLAISLIGGLLIASRTGFYGARAVYFVPGFVLLICLTVDRCRSSRTWPVRLRSIDPAFALIVVAVGGLLIDPGVRTVQALQQSEQRDYGQVEAFVASIVQEGDVVFGSFATYYAVEAVAGEFIGRFHEGGPGSKIWVADEIGPTGPETILGEGTANSEFLRTVDVIFTSTARRDVDVLTSADGAVEFVRVGTLLLGSEQEYVGNVVSAYGLIAFARR
jgi:hypothetical protein